MGKALTELIVEWQKSGNQESFSALARASCPIIEHAVTKLLRRSRFCTSSVMDEVRSRVWDHLRRLHPYSCKERPVTAFRSASGDDDPGMRYVRWLTRRRMLDVVREERRRLRKAPTLTEAHIDHSLATIPAAKACGPRPSVSSVSELRRAAELLPQPKKKLLEMLLQGRKQRAIAGVLGVSEATVSRLRRDAIVQLRTMLSGEPEERPRETLGFHSASPSPSTGRDSMPQPFVTIQYETRSASNLSLERHFQWYAFGCLLDGAVSVTWSRRGKQQTSNQQAGTCNFFAPDEAASQFSWVPTSETTFHTVLVPPDYFKGVATSEGICQATLLRPVFGFHDQEIENHIRQLGRHHKAENNLSRECLGRSLVLRMLELQGYGPMDWQSDESVFTAGEVQRIVEYIDANLCCGTTLEQMARVPGLSPSHFDRKFHRSFGLTPSRFVAVRRVQRVVDLLRTTEDTVAGISQRAGFCSSSHCTNTFRAMIGIPPSRFRAEVLFPKKSQPSAKDNGDGKARP